MPNQSENYIKNAAMHGNHTPCTSVLNTPAQYANRQHQYYAKRTAQFIKARAQYASDFVQADVQGLVLDDFYKYVSTYIRFSDIASQSATGTKSVDDVKVILFQEPTIDYFPIGAKLQTMGSTWLCTNPSNISSVHATAIVQRCNAAYSLYDYYGNILTEPIVVEKVAMASNDNSNPQNLVLMEGYFNVTCQLNENTRQLGQNQRIILGSKAYHITGFTDFIQEFTGDYDSVHVLRFSIRIEEPHPDDDLINHIANGKNCNFSAEITGAETVSVGESTELQAHFIRNGNEVFQSEEHPLTWDWHSLDETIATVDQNGNVKGISPGEVKIYARLKESRGNLRNDSMITELGLDVDIESGQLLQKHPVDYIGTCFSISGNSISAITPKNICPADFNYSDVAIESKDGEISADIDKTGIIVAAFSMNVKTSLVGNYVGYTSIIPQCIRQYMNATFTAAYFENGLPTEQAIVWTYSGAESSNYTAQESGNTVTITCLGADDTPLTVTATCAGQSASVEIKLEGY